MKTIFKRTLVDTLKIPAIILMTAAGIIGGMFLTRNLTESSSYMAFLNDTLVRQHLIVFFLVNGAALYSIVCSVCSGLIAGEVHEGTFRILVAKPNSRITILVSKILGVFTGTMILMVLGLSAMYAAEILSVSWDGNIMNDMLKYFPGYVLYGLITTFFLSSLSVLLSTIAKKRVIALLPMLLILIMILALPVIVRVVLSFSQRTPPALMNLVDINYHFGLIFKWCCDLCGGFAGTGSQMELTGLLMNIFTTVQTDMDIARSYSNPLYISNDMLPTLGVLAVYLIFGLINYVSSILIINNKNV